MGRRSRGTVRSSVRVFVIEETDEDQSGPDGPGPRSHGEVPDGAAPVQGAGVGRVPQVGAGDEPRVDERPARRRWSRRARLLVGAGVSVVALLAVGGVVRGEMNESARVERVVAAGGIRPLGPEVGVRWRIEPGASGDDDSGWWLSPVVVDGTLVVPGSPAVGYDPTTGRELWRGAPRPESDTARVTTGCTGTGTRAEQEDPLVCTTFELRSVPTDGATFEQSLPVRIDVMVAATGEVTGSRTFREGTQGAAVFDDGVASVRWGDDGHVVVDLEDLATGELRWSREIDEDRGNGPGEDYLGLQDGGSVLMVAVAGRLVTLDAQGRTVDEAEDSWTSPLRDGLAVVQHPDGASTVLDPGGAELFRTRGTVQEFAVTDGGPSRVFLVTEGGGVMDESGNIEPPRTTALDAATGRTRWSADGVSAPVAQVGEVGILSEAGRLRAVDLGSGRRLWESSDLLAYSSAYTDGTDLYLVGTSAGGGTRITAVSVDSGQELWSSDLTDLFVWGASARGTLVVATDDGTLLGIG
ncbi:PQQ-binding-like beta-propeller repeat protein [Oerskovia sp. NPDC056781]|uniref:outer membrane protein assembly factor BamB family protein n=1 Tax=Oerskovia sp. NPDC056781 TaxID=3345942 RepID=UPI003670B7FE